MRPTFDSSTRAREQIRHQQVEPPPPHSRVADSKVGWVTATDRCPFIINGGTSTFPVAFSGTSNCSWSTAATADWLEGIVLSFNGYVFVRWIFTSNGVLSANPWCAAEDVDSRTEYLCLGKNRKMLRRASIPPSGVP